MRVIVFGTGADAEKLFSDNSYRLMMRKVEIVAFTDNDHAKWSMSFHGYAIISPSEIDKYDYDYVLIASSKYARELREQCVLDMGMDASRILSLEYVFANFLIHDINLPSAETLIVGNADFDSTVYNDVFNEVLHVCGHLDYRHFDQIKDYRYDYIIFMVDFTWEDDEKVLFHPDHAEQVIAQGVVRSRVFTYWAVECLLRRERRFTYGDKHGEKTFLVYRPVHKDIGLGCMINNVARNVFHACQKGYIPVVDWRGENQYLEPQEIGRVNAWEKFFQQPGGYGLDDISEAQNVVVVNKGIGSEEDDVSFLAEKPELSHMITQFEAAHFRKDKKVLGLLYRGSDYVNRKPKNHAVQPDIEEFISITRDKFHAWGGFDKIYICTEVQEAIDRFIEAFGDNVIYYPQERVSENFSKLLCQRESQRENDAFLWGAEYFAALHALSRCNALIAGQCGGTVLAQSLNKHMYEHEYIFQLGWYGVDDQKEC